MVSRVQMCRMERLLLTGVSICVSDFRSFARGRAPFFAYWREADDKGS
jgi:hypothetical protein